MVFLRSTLPAIRERSKALTSKYSHSMTPDRDQKRENVHRASELSRLLDEWDPLGVYGGDGGEPPPGEYSDLVWPIIRMLDEGVNSKQRERGMRDSGEKHSGTKLT